MTCIINNTVLVIDMFEQSKIYAKIACAGCRSHNCRAGIFGKLITLVSFINEQPH